MFFESWYHIFKLLIAGSLAYLGLVFILRISGKRTLAQLSAVDFIGTVALGSILANVIIIEDIPLVEGLVSFALLIFLQVSIAWLTFKFQPLKKFIHATPRLLFYKGNFKESIMDEEKITKEEILHAVREKGFISLDQVGAVVLEINGMFSVMEHFEDGEHSSIENVQKD